MASPADLPAARANQRITELVNELHCVRSTLNQVREVAFGAASADASFRQIRTILGENWAHTQLNNGQAFDLVRHQDFSGKSGTGRVAEGFVFEDGTVAMRWKSARASTNIYASIEDVIAVHGHGGATQVEYR